MSLSYQSILNVRVTTSPKEKILEDIKKYLLQSIHDASSRKVKVAKPLVITTPNPEQIVLAQSDSHFRDILNWADIALPDGIGLVVASRILGKKSSKAPNSVINERTTGVDFMLDLVGLADVQGVRIGLIGGIDGLAVKALECLQLRYPKLKGWAADGPELTGDTVEHMEWPEDSYWENLSQKISATGTGILFVGLGAPKQEYVIDRLRTLSNSIVLMSVGGSFDIITGRLKRAPLFIRTIGFEWFWRLLQEPWRWRRQLSLMMFIWLVLSERFVPSLRKRV